MRQREAIASHDEAYLAGQRARYYDASLGRFVTRDPAYSPDRISFYAYSMRNSIITVDPSGETNVVYSANRGIFQEATLATTDPDTQKELFGDGVSATFNPIWRAFPETFWNDDLKSCYLVGFVQAARKQSSSFANFDTGWRIDSPDNSVFGGSFAYRGTNFIDPAYAVPGLSFGDRVLSRDVHMTDYPGVDANFFGGYAGMTSAKVTAETCAACLGRQCSGDDYYDEGIVMGFSVPGPGVQRWSVADLTVYGCVRWSARFIFQEGVPAINILAIEGKSSGGQSASVKKEWFPGSAPSADFIQAASAWRVDVPGPPHPE